GSMLTGAFKEFMKIALALTDPHFEDVVDADGHESRLYFSSGSTCHMRFAASWRAVHQNAAANGFAISLVEFGMFQRVNDLHPNLFLDGVHSSHIFESDGRPFHFSLRPHSRLLPGDAPLTFVDLAFFGVRSNPQARVQLWIGHGGVQIKGFAVLPYGAIDLTCPQQQPSMHNICGGGCVRGLEQGFDHDQGLAVLVLMKESSCQAYFEQWMIWARDSAWRYSCSASAKRARPIRVSAK